MSQKLLALAVPVALAVGYCAGYVGSKQAEVARHPIGSLQAKYDSLVEGSSAQIAKMQQEIDRCQLARQPAVPRCFMPYLTP